LKKKILIIGGSGLLGKRLNEFLEKTDYEVYATYHQNPIKKKGYFQLNITRKPDVIFIMKKIAPHIIIHTAADTNVDRCEINRKSAYEINVQGTKNVAVASENVGAKLMYISTDYVFDGKKGCYKEIDATNPINYYGVTKFEGEETVKTICSDFIIARTAVVYGYNKKNFATWIIERLKKGNKINIVDDQYISPTLNVDLAEQLMAIIENDKQGVFHTAGAERINRYEFAIRIANSFDLDKTLINSVKMSDMNWVASRPYDSSLNVSKISRMKKPYNIRKAIQILKDEMRI